MNELEWRRIHMAAARGALYLDLEASVQYPDIVPVHWHRVIDLNAFDMGCPTRCLLSQLGQASRKSLLHKGTVALALALHPKAGEIVEKGFLLRYPAPGDYAELTRAWANLVLDRRAADKSTFLIAS